MDMTTNSDLTSEVGSDFSWMIRLVRESQRNTPTYMAKFAIKRVCMCLRVSVCVMPPLVF